MAESLEDEGTGVEAPDKVADSSPGNKDASSPTSVLTETADVMLEVRSEVILVTSVPPYTLVGYLRLISC